MYNAKLEIKEYIKKDNTSYEKLAIHLIREDGTTVNIHEIYMTDNLKQIIQALAPSK